MNLYGEFLVAFILVFAAGYTLVYLPGVLKIRSLYKRNILFLLFWGVVNLLADASLKHSYFYAIGFIFLAYNIYLFYTDKRKNPLKVVYAIADFVVYSLVLFLSACIIAQVDDIPIKMVVIERFADGSYSFAPGCLDEMITLSAILPLFIVNCKYVYIYLITKWEERQNRKYRHLSIRNKT